MSNITQSTELVLLQKLDIFSCERQIGKQQRKKQRAMQVASSEVILMYARHGALRIPGSVRQSLMQKTHEKNKSDAKMNIYDDSPF